MHKGDAAPRAAHYRAVEHDGSGETSMSDEATATVVDGTAWARFCDDLKRAGDQILRAETPDGGLDRAEG